MRVHFLHHPERLDVLEAALSDGIHLSLTGATPPDADVLVGGRPGPVDLIPSLSAMVIPYAGLPQKTAALLADHPELAVYNLHHNAPAVAEMALALLLAVTRRMRPMDEALRRFDWRARYLPDPAWTLQGRTVLILGLGAIGRRLVAPLRALGATVLATRRRVDGAREHDGVQVFPASALDDLLPRADAVVVALPHTAETIGLLDDRRLALLPEGAALVNVARAAIIEEQALYAALASGRLCGAGLDVWYRYPDSEAAREGTPPCTAPLWELPNVVFSPHRAGHVTDTEPLRMAALAASLNALAAGEEPPGRVDVAAGY